MRRILLSLVVLSVSAAAHAEEISETLGVNKDRAGGFGSSAVLDLFAFRPDGTFDVFNAGAGFGVSYKKPLDDGGNSPIEVGLYIAPAVVKPSEGSDATASVSTLLHVAFFGAFGLGAGLTFWRSGEDEGFQTPDDHSLFFTVGYGLTNDVRPKTQEPE